MPTKINLIRSLEMSKWGDVVTDSGRLEFPDTKLGIRSEKNDQYVS